MSPAIQAQQLRTEQFALALKLIRASLRTEEQLCDLLYCAGNTLDESNFGTLIKQDVELIDALADVINYRKSSDVEELIDAVKSITTLEVTE